MKYFKIFLEIKNNKDVNTFREKMRQRQRLKFKKTINRNDRIVDSKVIFVRAESIADAAMIAKKIKYSIYNKIEEINFDNYMEGVKNK